MPGQPVIPGLRTAMKKKVTRREKFLDEMDRGRFRGLASWP